MDTISQTTYSNEFSSIKCFLFWFKFYWNLFLWVQVAIRRYWFWKRLGTKQTTCITRTTWWRHQMETFSALLAICAGNSPVPGEFPAQRPVTRSFDVFFDLHPNKRLSKQWWGWWFEMLSRPLWRHRNYDDQKSKTPYGVDRPQWVNLMYLATWTWVNIVSGNGLLPDGTKSLLIISMSKQNSSLVKFRI